MIIRTILTLILLVSITQAQVIRTSPSMNDDWVGLPTGNNTIWTKCGTWVSQPEVTSDWETVDTIGGLIRLNTKITCDWVFSDWVEINSGWMTLTNDTRFPCGERSAIVREQWRICRYTGIRQRRTSSISFNYVPPPVPEYDRIVDSLISEKNKVLEYRRKLSGYRNNSGIIDSTLSISTDTSFYWPASANEYISRKHKHQKSIK